MSNELMLPGMELWPAGDVVASGVTGVSDVGGLVVRDVWCSPEINFVYFSTALIAASCNAGRLSVLLPAGGLGVSFVKGRKTPLIPKKVAANIGLGITTGMMIASLGNHRKTTMALAAAGAGAAGANAFFNYCLGCKLYDVYNKNRGLLTKHKNPKTAKRNTQAPIQGK